MWVAARTTRLAGTAGARAASRSRTARRSLAEEETRSHETRTVLPPDFASSSARALTVTGSSVFWIRHPPVHLSGQHCRLARRHIPRGETGIVQHYPYPLS